MKKILVLFLFLGLTGLGCADQPIVEVIIDDEPLMEEPAMDEEVSDNTEATETEEAIGQIYVQFVQNVHDWVYPEQSIETLHRVIDLHEEYELPVELHLTDTVTQAYVEMAPDLIERFKTSEYVSISYHVRPPHPIVNGFDTMGLNQMDSEQQYEVLKAIEESELNIYLGGYNADNPGGFQYLKDLIGYAPRIVGQTNGPLGKIYSQVLEEKGALFTVLHENGSSLEETLHGLHKRPEDTEVKLYELAEQDYDMEELFSEWTEDFNEEDDFFVNLKFHENNYYLTNTPFGPIYWDDFPEGRRDIAEPPYDIDATRGVNLRSDAKTELRWTLYETALEYVANNQDWLTAINAANLEQMLEEIE